MAATLGADLIFDMNRCCAELDHRLDCTRHVERGRAETGIHVHQQRQVADIGDTTYVGQHVIQASDAQVRQAERTCCHAATRKIDGFETGALGQQCVVGIDRAYHLQWMFAGDGITETLTGSSFGGTHFSPRAVGWGAA